jgi:hypothetical protein
VSKGIQHNEFPPTEFVRSHYRSTWTGAVLVREKREYNGKRIGDLLTVVLVRDSHGNPMKRKIVQTIDASWTTPIAPIDISDINPDWWIIRDPLSKGSR